MPSVRHPPQCSDTRYPRMRIAIIVFSVAALGAVWALVLERVRFETNETISDVIRQNSNLAIAFEEHTIRTLKGVDQALLFVKHEYEKTGPKANVRKLIQDSEIDDDLFSYIGVADEKGRTVLSSFEITSANCSDREYFTFHQGEDKRVMFIGKPLLGRVSGKWGIQLSRRLNRPDGSFGGIVFASLDSSYFTRFYRKADLGEEGVVMLIGLDGIVRARQAGKIGTFGEDLRGSTLFAQQGKAASGNFLSLGRIGGMPRFHSYRTLKAYPLIVSVGRSETEVLAQLHQRARGYRLGAALVSAMAVVFAAALLLALARQQRANDLVAKNEARFRTLIEHAPDFVMVLDRDGVLRYVSPAVRRISGYEPGELIGHSLLEFLHPDDAAEARQDHCALVANESIPLRTRRYRHHDGSWRMIETVTRNELESPAVRGIVVNARDVTAQRHIEEALRVSEEQFVQLAEHIPEVFWITDLRANASIYISAAYEQISGLRIAPLASAWSRWQDRVHPDDCERVCAANQNLRGGSLDHEYRILRADGSMRWVHARGYPVRDGAGAVCRMVGTIEDITERKRADEVQAQLATIVETSPDAILGAAPDGTVLSWNAGAEKLFGYAAAEMIGKKAYELIVPADRMAECMEMRASVRAGKVVSQFETERVDRDGRRIPVSLSSAPIMDASGKVVRISTILRDMTERTRFAHELRQYMELLQTIVDNIPVALVDLDATGRAKWVNRHWEHILGWSLEESRERHLLPEMYPDSAHHKETVQCALTSSATWSDFPTRTKDGRMIDMSWANVLLSDGTSIGIGQDVTERKLAEKALSGAKARLQAIFESSPLAIITLDRAGMVKEWNPAAERMFGWSRDEALDHPMPIIPDYQMDRFHSLLAAEFEITSYAGFELVRRKKDGSPIAVRLWTAPLRDGNGNTINVVGLFEDITEHRRYQQALRESEAQLRRARDKRERLSRDLHDGIIQDIYAVGLGLEQVGRLVAEDAGKARTGLSAALARLNEVIRTVRKHIAGLEREIVGAEPLHAELQALMRTVTVAHGMQFQLEASPSALSQFSPNAADEVLNIIREAVSNSLRHSGGVHGVVSLTERDGRALLIVEDDGAGFDVLKPHESGRGLRNIAARAHVLGAQLDIRSSPGRGTRVIVDMPLENTHVIG